MRILISNDDGIHAPGLRALRKALTALGEVWVVAPDRERSGTGHGITTYKPLRAKKVSFSDGTAGWAINGTPADCVKLGIEALLPEKPDIVVSGINQGANLSTDVLYSGTVSAAIEGLVNNCPSAALSLASFESSDFTEAAKLAAFIVPWVVNMSKKEKNILVNANIPPGTPKGIKLTRLGIRRYINVFDKRTDPRGNEYYWMAGEPEDNLKEPDNDQQIDIDVEAINNNYISITPLHFDLTDFNAVSLLGVTPIHL